MPPPPLLGYNNNVRHRGRIFHIQTEDSGITSPRIMTHLFADGGRIVKSTRTDYSEHLGRDDMAAVVKNMMKEQHKAMFVALRSGELDGLIGFSKDDAPAGDGLSSAVLAKGVAISSSEQKQPAQVNPASVSAVVPTTAGQVAVAVNAKAVLGDQKAYGASRPASIFTAPPPSSNSIFGEVGIDEKSLDDAILSYLAEDPEDRDEDKKREEAKKLDKDRKS